MTRSVDESLRRLGVAHLDLIQCHDIEFGSLKQVVEEISREFSRLDTFVTLSPAPGFAGWLARERTSESPILTREDLEPLEALDRPGWWQDGAAEQLEEFVSVNPNRRERLTDRRRVTRPRVALQRPRLPRSLRVLDDVAHRVDQ